MNIFKQKKQKGFALLFSVLISTLVVSITATIISISMRQFVLSSTSRESQLAFYAANTALECAFYWDTVPLDPSITGAVFPIGTESLVDNPATIKCSNIQILTSEAEHQFTENGEDNTTTVFKLKIKDTANSPSAAASGIERCAEVNVQKELTDGLVETWITAKGYNSCDLTNPRTVERGLELNYQS